jgi:hypothetical protein
VVSNLWNYLIITDLFQKKSSPLERGAEYRAPQNLKNFVDDVHPTGCGSLITNTNH